MDGGSREFDGAPTDTVVHTVSAFTLTAGVQNWTFGNGNTNAQLPFGNPTVYFVVADITSNAVGQTPSGFQVGHVTDGSSAGETIRFNSSCHVDEGTLTVTTDPALTP